MRELARAPRCPRFVWLQQWYAEYEATKTDVLAALAGAAPDLETLAVGGHLWPADFAALARLPRLQVPRVEECDRAEVCVAAAVVR